MHIYMFASVDSVCYQACCNESVSLHCVPQNMCHSTP